MFTQRDEEPFILDTFAETIGRFLDIGAYDGKCFSTSYALVLKGWEGVCVEPSPSVLPALYKLHENNSKIEIIPAAVSNVTGSIDFYDCGGDMVSSINKGHVELWEKKGNVTFDKIQVNSYTIVDLFEKVGYDFDYISLDVEGTNLDIFKQFPFAKLTKTKLMCIEFDHEEEKVLNLAKPFGFKELHRTAENLLLIRS